MAEAGPSGAREPEEGDDSSEEDDNVSVFEMSSEAESPRRPPSRASFNRPGAPEPPRAGAGAVRRAQRA